MDTPAKAALGGGLLSTLAIGGMLAAGVLATSAALVTTDPSAAPARADGLVRFADCDALRDWYVDHTVDEVGPWGWGGRMVPMMAAEDLARTPGNAMPDTAVGNGATGTNTQETDVDEPDLAKTDGRLVVRVRDGQRLVVTDVTGSEPRQLADWRLPEAAYADSLLLVGDHALLTGGSSRVMGREGFVTTGSGSTEVYDVDLSDPAQPRLEDHSSWAGRQLSMRQYGDTVRLVTSIGLPELRFVQPQPGILDEHQAERRNREIVRTSRIEDWTPGLSCGEVFHPKTWSGPDTVAVWTFRPGEENEASKVAVTGAGSEVYSSTDRLYVTSTDRPSRPILLDRADTSVPSDRFAPGGTGATEGPPRTHLHAFALDGDRTRYVASGTVSGSIKDRWSLDEHDGHLRVAVSRAAGDFTARDNGVVVLDEHGTKLEQVGALRGLGVGEQVQSVRWFDDLAVLVTFRQTDPLYTVDLTDPTEPRRLGELKIPGFSSYLHPIGDDRLLGIGSDATETGQQLGAQAAVFDIADIAQARQVGKVTLGQGSWLEAADDPHAFTWLPEQHAAITSLQGGSHSSMVLLRVAADGSVSSHDLGSVGGWSARALPLADGRVALVGDRVRVVDLG